MKRIACILLILMLGVVNLNVLAESDLASIQPLLDAITQAALVCEVDLVDGTPSAALAAEAIHTLLETHYVQGEIVNESYYADDEMLTQLYNALFATGSFQIPEATESYDIACRDNGLTFALNNRINKAGAVPMLAEKVNDRLIVVCELYISDRPDYDPAADDVTAADWIGTAEFTLQKDVAAPYGYTLQRFNRAMDTADENPLTVYMSETLGFSFAYPTELADYLIETETGITASLPNNQLSLNACVESNSGYVLESYGMQLEDHLEGSLLSLYSDSGYFTIAYEQKAEERTCYRVVWVTDTAIYEAELSFLTELEDLYGMFAEYLENSFTVFEYAVG